MNQLIIPLHAAPSYASEDFVISSSNRLAYDSLMQWPHWPDYGYWLCGESGSGKSHLASLWQSAAKAIRPASLEHALTQGGALLIDPVPDLTCAHTASALFHLLNHVKQARSHVLLVANQSPAHTPCPLPDLHSRLKALPVATLNAPDESLLSAVWFKAFADKQLQVAPAVIDYLCAHCERSFAAIQHHVERIDRAALTQKRAVTIPLIKSLLHPNE